MEQTATNPQTGEKLVFRGGQWQPLTGSPAPAPEAAPGVIMGRPKAPTAIQLQDQQFKIEDRAFQREKFNWERQQAEAKAAKETGTPAYSQSAIDAFDRAISTAERLKTHPGFGAAVGSGFDPQSFGSYNPLNGKVLGGTNAAGFESDLEAMKAQVFLPMVQSMKGMGALSNAEGDKLTAAIGSLNPNMPEEQFQASLDRIMGDLKTYRDRGSANTASPDATQTNNTAMALGGVDKSTNIIDPNTPIIPQGPNYKAGPVESYVTDADRARTDKLQAAYNSGVGPAELNRLAVELGTQPFPADDMRVLMEARQRGEQVQIAPFASGQQGAIEKAISTVADSPVGAYGIGAANAVTLGGLDEIAGFVGGDGAGERAQFAKQYSRENSPLASLTGEVAGFTAASMLPGVAGTMASVKGGATLGGIYGGLDTNDNRLGGAALGAITGGVANKYAPQVTNALAQFAQPAVQGTRNALTSVANRLPGAEARNIARQEVAQNADVIAAGQAEGINVRQPDVRPSLRDQYGGAEASQFGGPKIQKAASEDAQAIADRLAVIGGGGTSQQGYNLGSATQDAVKAEKAAMSKQAGALFDRVDLQAPGFMTQPTNLVNNVDDKIAASLRDAPEGNEAYIGILDKLKSNFSKTGISTATVKANRAIVRKYVKDNNLQLTSEEVALIDVIDTAAKELETALQSSGNSAAAQTLKRANKEWSDYSDFKRDIVRTIVGTKNQPVQPETAAKRLLAMVTSGGPSDKFAKIYAALPVDEKAGFKALIAENLGKNARGDFSLALLAKGLDQKNINYKSLRKVFSPDEFQSLMNLRRLADAKDKAMSGKNFSNTARAANNAPTGFGAFVRGALGFSVGDIGGATVAVVGPNIAERIGTKRTVDMLLNTDFSKWLSNMPNTTNPRAIDAYLKKLDNIKAPAVASNVVIFKDYLRQVATQSPGKLAASENEGDGRPIPPQQ